VTRDFISCGLGSLQLLEWKLMPGLLGITKRQRRGPIRAVEIPKSPVCQYIRSGICVHVQIVLGFSISRVTVLEINRSKDILKFEKRTTCGEFTKYSKNAGSLGARILFSSLL
jgi:hypothetical protein